MILRSGISICDVYSENRRCCGATRGICLAFPLAASQPRRFSGFVKRRGKALAGETFGPPNSSTFQPAQQTGESFIGRSLVSPSKGRIASCPDRLEAYPTTILSALAPAEWAHGGWRPPGGVLPQPPGIGKIEETHKPGCSAAGFVGLRTGAQRG